jgi:hypothetical protein
MAAADATRTTAGRADALIDVDSTTSSSGGGRRLGAAARTAAAALLVWPTVAAGHDPAAAGTHVASHTDVRQLVAGTHLYDVAVEGPLVPFVRPTRMARIRELASFSLRDWASVFSVSYTAVGQWLHKEPPGREKLTMVRDALERAAQMHGDLRSWLTLPLSGTDVTPLELLREERWRAFDGALHVQAVGVPTIAPDELLRRRQAEVSWALPELHDGDETA